MKNKTKSVVFFGDSHLGRFNRDRIEKLENAVSNIKVYNCAVGGWDTRDGSRKVDFIAKLNPDIVVLSFAGNDSTFWKKISLDELKSNLDKIIKAFEESEIIFFPSPPADERFQDVPNFNESLAKYNNAAKAIAQKNKLKIIDPSKLYSRLDNKSYHLEDGIHLNEYGYEIFIKELAKLLV